MCPSMMIGYRNKAKRETIKKIIVTLIQMLLNLQEAGVEGDEEWLVVDLESVVAHEEEENEIIVSKLFICQFDV